MPCLLSVCGGPEVGLTREYVGRGRIGSHFLRIGGVTRDTRTVPSCRHVPGMNPPPTSETTMRTRTRTLTLAGATLAGATLLAACGSGGGGSPQAAASAPRTRPAHTATAATVGV